MGDGKNEAIFVVFVFCHFFLKRPRNHVADA